MTENTLGKAFVIAGSGEGKPSSRLFEDLWQQFHKEPTLELANKLNVILAAGEVGKMLTKLGWQVMTGGYYEGPMGRVSASAHIAANRQIGPQPLAAVFSDIWPGDELEAHGEKVPMTDMDERTGLFLKNANNFFFF